MSVEQNMRWAIKAIAYTRTKVLGCTNYGQTSSPITRRKTRRGLRMLSPLKAFRFGRKRAKFAAGARARGAPQSLAQWIMELHYADNFACLMRAGNCGEQAAVAYVYLYHQGVRPLEYVTLANGGHVFVLIGREAGSSLSDYKAWGDEAVVCDPWDNNAYPVAGYFAFMMSKMPAARGCTKVCSVGRVQ